MIETFKRWFCNLIHTRIEFPGGPIYRCASCGCTFPVPWAQKEAA